MDQPARALYSCGSEPTIVFSAEFDYFLFVLRASRGTNLNTVLTIGALFTIIPGISSGSIVRLTNSLFGTAPTLLRTNRLDLV